MANIVKNTCQVFLKKYLYVRGMSSYVSFNEDKCRARVKNEALSIALIRRISMAYLKKDLTTKSGIKCKRKKASWDDSYLFKILSLGLNAQVISTACEK